MPLQPGTTLGPYRVTAKIGEGGMGEVYRARDTKLDRDVALKVLPQAFTDDPDRLSCDRTAHVRRVTIAGPRHRSVIRALGAKITAFRPCGVALLVIVVDPTATVTRRACHLSVAVALVTFLSS